MKAAHRVGLRALSKLARETRKRTLEARDEVKEKRARKAKVGKKKPPPRPKRAPNSKDLEALFREKLWERAGEKFVVPPWTVKQRKQAKELISIYGIDLAKRGVEHLFERWSEICRSSNGRISGVPTISFLYGARERIFGELQAPDLGKARPKKDSDEYTGENAPEGTQIGW